MSYSQRLARAERTSIDTHSGRGVLCRRRGKPAPGVGRRLEIQLVVVIAAVDAEGIEVAAHQRVGVAERQTERGVDLGFRVMTTPFFCRPGALNAAISAMTCC